MDVGVVGNHVARQTAELTMQGEFTKARVKSLSAQKMLHEQRCVYMYMYHACFLISFLVFPLSFPHTMYFSSSLFYLLCIYMYLSLSFPLYLPYLHPSLSILLLSSLPLSSYPPLSSYSPPLSLSLPLLPFSPSLPFSSPLSPLSFQSFQ